MFEFYMLNEIDSRSYVVELFSVALCTKVEGVDSRPLEIWLLGVDDMS